jgi:hypothetical protein
VSCLPQEGFQMAMGNNQLVYNLPFVQMAKAFDRCHLPLGLFFVPLVAQLTPHPSRSG